MISNCRRTFGRFITFIGHQFSEGFCNMLIPSQVESLRSFSDIYTVTVTLKIIYFIIHQKKMSRDQHVTYSSETGWSIKVINRLIVFPQMEITYFFICTWKILFIVLTTRSINTKLILIVSLFFVIIKVFTEHDSYRHLITKIT